MSKVSDSQSRWQTKGEAPSKAIFLWLTYYSSVDSLFSHLYVFRVPPFAAAWVVTCLTAFLADRYNRRGVASAIASLFAAIMFAILGGLPDGHYTARYVILILANSGAFASIPPLLGWLSANSRNTTAAAITIPINVSFGGIGQIIGVWIYKADEAPKYPTGQVSNFEPLGYCR